MFYSFDSEGNVAQRIDANGNVLSSHPFSAHGSVVTGSLSDPFGYKAQFGYYTDSEIGLQLLTHRYYDSSTNRFLTRDPIHYAGGINLYAYVRNNAVRWTDLMGTDIFGLGVGVSGYVGFGGMGAGLGGSFGTVYGYNTADGTLGTASSYGGFYPGGGDPNGVAVGSAAGIACL